MHGLDVVVEDTDFCREDLAVESLMGTPRIVSNCGCVTGTTENVFPGPDANVITMDRLRALASSQRQELQSLFACHLQQQQNFFEGVASSTKLECASPGGRGGSTLEDDAEPPFGLRASWPLGSHGPRLVVPPVKTCLESSDSHETLAEARQLDLSPNSWRQPDSPGSVAVGKLAAEHCLQPSPLLEKRGISDDSEESAAGTHGKTVPTINGVAENSLEVLGRWQRCCFEVHKNMREPNADTPLKRLIHHAAFKYFVSVIILVNTVTTGLRTQDRVKAAMAERSVDPEWESWELAFCVIFIVEIVIRLLADRLAFFYGSDWRWNMFDSLIVIHSFVDQVANFAPNVNFARVLRIVRFLRILRLVRVFRAFLSFRLMVNSILGSLKNLLWILLWMFFVLYSFSIFFLHGVAESYSDVNSDTQNEMRLYYGSVFECVLTLFMSVTGGDDWNNRMQPLRSIPTAYMYAFILYIFFMVFGLVNIVVASFVETAAEISRRDRDSMIEQQISQAQRVAEDIRAFFRDADTDKSGDLNRDEFKQHLQDDRVKAFFASLDLDVGQASDLFDLLDTDDDGCIGLDEFLAGCMRLRGTATSMDVNLLLWEVEKLMCKVSAVARDMQRSFHTLEELVGSQSRPDLHNQIPSSNPRKKQHTAWTGDVRKRNSATWKIPTFGSGRRSSISSSSDS